MARIATTRSTLRLVDAGDEPARAALPRNDELAARRARAVEAENRAAASLSEIDARAIFAADVAEQLQGGYVALLTPDRRKGLMSRAAGLGLRPFDANLIIAIVQDRARGGELESHPRHDARLGMIRPAGVVVERAERPMWKVVVVTAGLALAMFAVLVMALRL